MKKQEIVSVLYDLYKITGFRISLHDVDFSEIAAYPEEKLPLCREIHKTRREYELCAACDREAFRRVKETKETYIYKCRYGLTEAVSPLYSFDVLTGFLMMGQIRIDGEGIDPMLLALAKVGKTDFDARVIASSVPSVKEEMIRSFVNIMTICASYLTLSNAVTTAKISVAQLTMKYINQNFSGKISVKDICDAVGYSKSTVLSSFKQEFGTTVNNYLTDLRLEKAKKMLKTFTGSVNDIALSCGFSDQSYFSKVFSSKYGISPSDFRRENKI